MGQMPLWGPEPWEPCGRHDLRALGNHHSQSGPLPGILGSLFPSLGSDAFAHAPGEGGGPGCQLEPPGAALGFRLPGFQPHHFLFCVTLGK